MMNVLNKESEVPEIEYNYINNISNHRINILSKILLAYRSSLDNHSFTLSK